MGNSSNGSHSTFESSIAQFSISNLMVFNKKLESVHCVMCLTTMGPDAFDLEQCHLTNWKPNYGYLDLAALRVMDIRQLAESLKLLRQTRILFYSSQSPYRVLSFVNPATETENLRYGYQNGLMIYGKLQQNKLTSFQTASLLCGGLSVLLYLFARVVELTTHVKTQALALDILLKTSLSESQLFSEFQRNDCMSLIGFVIKSERCSKNIYLLKSIVNNSCSQNLITENGNGKLQINDACNAVLIYPQLIISVLRRYSDWHRSGAENSDVLDLLLRAILSLTREKHPQRDFNIQNFQKADLIKEMLNLCKVYVIESPNPVYMSRTAAKAFVEILYVFVGSPPSPSIMDEVMKLLLLLQRPSECYVVNDRSKLYFLITTKTPPAKEKCLKMANLSRVTGSFRKNTAIKTTDEDVNNSKNNDNNNKDERAELAKRVRRQKLRTATSTYKCIIDEFEDNLESIADCSNLNKAAFRLLSPEDVRRWHAKYKRSTNYERVKSSQKSNCPLQRSQTISRKPIHALNLFTRSLKSTAQSSLSDSAFMKRKFQYQHKLAQSTKHRIYSSLGIQALQEGLLTLLTDFFRLLPDAMVDEVLKHFLQLKLLLVMANHSSPGIRAAVIKLLAVLINRLPQTELAAYNKQFYPVHLANQLTVYPSDAHMFEACMTWVTGAYGNLKTILRGSPTALRIQQKFGLNALLALITRIPINQVDYAESAIQLLERLYAHSTENQLLMCDAGLLQCCAKALYNFYESQANDAIEKFERAAIKLLTAIGSISLLTVGQINVIWELLNLLTFYEDMNLTVRSHFRALQATLLLELINIYFERTKNLTSYKVVIPAHCTISHAECKTRLELLIDRSAQFFTINELNKETPTKSEILLFEFLVSYSIATNQRCNFIAWGLQPSRPYDLRAFIVDKLWHVCADVTQSAIICDGKRIKTLLWVSLLEDLNPPIAKLDVLCQRLGITEDDTIWDLGYELECLSMLNTSATAKQKSLLDRTAFKYESLAQSCIETSMELTRQVVELQNAERKQIMYYMKYYDDTFTLNKWLEIIKRMTHEGAPWYCEARAETSWELDDTEGPSRARMRLRRCHLNIAKKFFMSDYKDEKNISLHTDIEFLRPLDYLITSYDQQKNFLLDSPILYNISVKYHPADDEIDGELIITNHKFYFLAASQCKYFNINCDIMNITEIWPMRYRHQDKAFEVFLETKKSLLFSLQNQNDWKILTEIFCDKIIAMPDSNKVQQFTQQWREGALTNWEYLTVLNQIAGRSYNDLMQYPIFPWILSNYETNVLDLTDTMNFRNFQEPIAIQHEYNRDFFINHFGIMKNSESTVGPMSMQPYHYSSLYSNTGTVLYFLVRVPPFTSYFLHYQDNNFDLPDRTFHTLKTTWNLASRDSTSDVKELIPEFFTLPEMFENFEHFKFGVRQNSNRVEDVELPPWCLKNSRLFVLIHRQALESEFVRSNLHKWIDLIFGYKQTGDSAVEAINVYHPVIYGNNLGSHRFDAIERRAMETMIRTYGQIPRQLFKTEHPSSKTLNYVEHKAALLSSIRGLRWGAYVGSPQQLEPVISSIQKMPTCDKLVTFTDTNVVYGLPTSASIVQGAEPDTFNVISYGYADNIVRIQPFNKSNAMPKDLLYDNTFDEITACGSVYNCNQLWFGHKSGRVSVYKHANLYGSQRGGAKIRRTYSRSFKLSYNSAFRKFITKPSNRSESDPNEEHAPSKSQSMTSITSDSNASNDLLYRDYADISWIGPTFLIRHTDAITNIMLSVEWRIAVTADRVGVAVIWDLTDWSYVRTIERPTEIHHSAITLVAISPTLGDIVTVHSLPNADDLHATESVSYAEECFEVTEDLDDFIKVSVNPIGKSTLRLHTVNGRYVNHLLLDDRITAICYSYIKEGVGINVIACALEGGIIQLRASWNLSYVGEINTQLVNIKSITYTTHQHLVVLDSDSLVQVWETDGLSGNVPKFPQITYK